MQTTCQIKNCKTCSDDKLTCTECNDRFLLLNNLCDTCQDGYDLIQDACETKAQEKTDMFIGIVMGIVCFGGLLALLIYIIIKQKQQKLSRRIEKQPLVKHSETI